MPLGLKLELEKCNLWYVKELCGSQQLCLLIVEDALLSQKFMLSIIFPHNNVGTLLDKFQSFLAILQWPEINPAWFEGQ